MTRLLRSIAFVALPAVAGLAAPAGTSAQATDAVVQVARGARLDLRPGPTVGRITIRAWDRDEVRVSASEPVRLSTEGSLVLARSDGVTSRDRPTWTVSVPAWLPVSATAVQAALDAEGIRADVSLESVGGSVRVRGGDGRVRARSVQGGVTVEDARGRIEASAVNAGVRITGATGQIQADATNGSIRLQDVDSDDVVAATVNGEVNFGGPIRDGGRYSLTSHNGRVSLTVQEGANATVTVSTYNGQFRTAFPVTLTATGPDRRTTFVIGTGSANVEASSFNGNVELRRP